MEFKYECALASLNWQAPEQSTWKELKSGLQLRSDGRTSKDHSIT